MPATVDLASDKARFDGRVNLRELVSQIRPVDLLAISGGRVVGRQTGVTLPVSNGYYVFIDLAGNDTYTVRRVFKRGMNWFLKGEVEGVHAEDLSETAYRASCFRNVEFGEG
jgi:hypothetical protein